MDVKPSQPDSSIPDFSKLSQSQRALLTARHVIEQLAQDAKQRQTAGVRVQSGAKGKAAALAAKQFGVSTRSVELALSVLRHEDPELIELVERGKVTVRRAAEIASLQPRALPSMERLLYLRARAFDNAEDTDQHVLDWVEGLHSNKSPTGSRVSGEVNRSADPRYWRPISDPWGKKPCPRCPAGSVDDCPLCHGEGFINVR